MTSQNEQNNLWKTYSQKAMEIKQAGMLDLFTVLNTTMDSISAMLEGSLNELPPQTDITQVNQYLQVIINGMDQIINIGSDHIKPIMINYLSELAVDALPWANGIGTSIEMMPEIVNMTQAYVDMNNWNLIRQIVPQIKNEIIQTFHTALSQGLMSPDYMAVQLSQIGLPYSPILGYSPGQRAGWIAQNECARIYAALNDNIRKEAGIDHCVNQLNPALKSHSSQCIAATRDGLIPVEDMIRFYGMPPRHFNCGCSLQYQSPEYYDNEINQMDLAMLEDMGYDTEAEYDKYHETGDREMQNEQNWQDNLHWENNVLETIFGKAA